MLEQILAFKMKKTTNKNKMNISFGSRSRITIERRTGCSSTIQPQSLQLGVRWCGKTRQLPSDTREATHTHTNIRIHSEVHSPLLRCCCTTRKKKQGKKKENSWRKCVTLEQMDTPERRFCEQKAWTKTVKLSGRQLKQQAERCYKCARNWMKL